MAKVSPCGGDDNLIDVPTQPSCQSENSDLGKPLPPEAQTPGITSKAFGVGDSEDIKNRVRASLLQKDKYDVMDDYKTSGIFQHVARSKPFENTTLTIIAVNAIWIAIDTDWNPATTLLDAHMVFLVAENIFCVYFTAEILIRFCAFEYKRKCLKSGWFVFDSVLVSFMILETWVFLALFSGSSPLGDQTSILRLFRLLRLSRLLKMLKSVPQLMILVKGMKEAMSGVVYVLLLLVVFTYVFAIICTQLSADNVVIREQYFDNVALSMYSLIIYATFLDALSDFLDAIRAENKVIFVIIWAYIGLSALTVMNMLIGVLCELISAVAETEKEIIITDNVNEEMKKVLQEVDADGNGTISTAEMQRMIVMPAAISALDNVGVDPVGMLAFAEAFFEDEKGMPVEKSFEEFMEMVLDLRASNGATLKDIQNLVKQVNAKFAVNQKAFESRIEALEGELHESTRRIEDVLQAVSTKIQSFKM